MEQIPLFDLNYGEEEEKAVLSTLRSKWISMGPRCEELAEKMSQDLSANGRKVYVCPTTSCTSALHLACVALGLGPGDEVICPSLTFAATANCIRYVGATPVFCDIVGVHDLGIDPDEIEKKITPATKAIIPMHFAGFGCNMSRIMEIAHRHHLYVIEDACHGPLSEYNGQKLGTFGDFGCFSFFSNKNVSTGEGGAIVTTNEELYQKVKLLRSHGMTTMSYERSKGHATSYDIVALGYNYRLDDIRASLACIQWDKLRPDIEKRAAVRQWYLKGLQGFAPITIPYADNAELVSNYIFPIVLNSGNREQRDRVRELLAENGIQTSIHYPAVHRFSIYQEFRSTLKNTEFVSDHEFTLPMYSALGRCQVEYICEQTQKAVESVLHKAKREHE